nr:type II secretion system protein [Mycetocola zhujimingii]
MTLIELVVAMMVFSLVTLSVAYSSIAIMTATRDARHRQVATNLAAQEIDRARSAGKILDLLNDTEVETVNGTTYTINRRTSWFNGTQDGGACAATDSGVGGALQYKQINVLVTWPNMTDPDSGVRADTLLAPESKINDPKLGTILVQVTNTNGGVSGIDVDATAEGDGAKTLTEPKAPTDAEGCTYLLRVTPGKYKVQISESGYVNEKNIPKPTQLVPVVAGGTSSARFTFDKSGSVKVTFKPDGSASGLRFPKPPPTSFVGTYGITAPEAASSSSTSDSATYKVFPSGGYSIVAGYHGNGTSDESTCDSVNPSLWEAVTVGEKIYEGFESPVVPSVPGSTSNVDVPTAAVTVTNSTTFAGTKIVAKSVEPPSATPTPSCAEPMTLTFDGAIAKGASANLALPYGAWTIAIVNSSSNQKLPTSSFSAWTGELSGVHGGDVLLLDPRRVVE